jgi:hypothetical protein
MSFEGVPMRVLVVDDERSIADSLSLILQARATGLVLLTPLKRRFSYPTNLHRMS